MRDVFDQIAEREDSSKRRTPGKRTPPRPPRSKKKRKKEPNIFFGCIGLAMALLLFTYLYDLERRDWELQKEKIREMDRLERETQQKMDEAQRQLRKLLEE